MRHYLLFLGLGLIGCGNGGSSAQTFGLVSPANGRMSLQNQAPDRPISGVVFANQGTRDVTIDQIQFLLASGQTVAGGAGVGVAAGAQVTYLYDSSATHAVASMSFAVHGTTESLVVLTTDVTGVDPGGPIQCAIRDQPSPAGGCCSEWQACAAGLTCQAVGPVYPGSAGICALVPECAIVATDYDQSCRQDSDCAAVFSGTVCGNECTCASAAINQASLGQYQADFATRVSGPSVCECAEIPAPRCVNAVCTL